MPAFVLRAATSADSAGLAELVAQSPDGGRVAFSPSYQVPFVEGMLARHREAVGVVAEVPGGDGLIGAAWISFGRCWVEGELVDYAVLNSLVVHPRYRRLGVASAMTRWRLEHIDAERPDGVVMAGIQTGNVASLANARKWANQVVGPVRVAPVPTRRRPPARRNDIEVREARRDELDDVAAGINGFYDGYNFARTIDAASLAAWTDEMVDGARLNHYFVAADQHGRLLTGVGIQAEAQLMTLRITHLPALLRAVNVAARVVPANREMRNANARMLWFATGQAAPARYLWQTIRWRWRHEATNLVSMVDRRGAAEQMLQTPRWLPTTSLSIAVRSNRPLNVTRLLDPPV